MTFFLTILFQLQAQFLNFIATAEKSPFLLLQNLPAWNAPSDFKASYAGIFFAQPPRATKSREQLWIAEMILVDHAGRITSFLLSYTGYQG